MTEGLELIFIGHPESIELYKIFEDWLLDRLDEIEIHPSKTQIGFFHSCGFAWVWPPRKKSEKGLGISLGLPAPVRSDRILCAVEAYPGRWTHHLLLRSAEDLDDELLGWIQEAYHFAAFRGKARRR